MPRRKSEPVSTIMLTASFTSAKKSGLRTLEYRLGLRRNTHQHLWDCDQLPLGVSGPYSIFQRPGGLTRIYSVALTNRTVPGFTFIAAGESASLLHSGTTLNQPIDPTTGKKKTKRIARGDAATVMGISIRSTYFKWWDQVDFLRDEKGRERNELTPRFGSDDFGKYVEFDAPQLNRQKRHNIDRITTANGVVSREVEAPTLFPDEEPAPAPVEAAPVVVNVVNLVEAAPITFKERLDRVKADARWLISQGVTFAQDGDELRATL